MESQVVIDLRDYVTQAFLFGDLARLPADETSLLNAGIIDSTGILELIEFIEATYRITVEDTETVPENLGSISNLAGYITRKLGSPA